MINSVQEKTTFYKKFIFLFLILSGVECKFSNAQRSNIEGVWEAEWTDYRGQKMTNTIAIFEQNDTSKVENNTLHSYSRYGGKLKVEYRHRMDLGKKPKNEAIIFCDLENNTFSYTGIAVTYETYGYDFALYKSESKLAYTKDGIKEYLSAGGGLSFKKISNNISEKVKKEVIDFEHSIRIDSITFQAGVTRDGVIKPNGAGTLLVWLKNLSPYNIKDLNIIMRIENKEATNYIGDSRGKVNFFEKIDLPAGRVTGWSYSLFTKSQIPKDSITFMCRIDKGNRLLVEKKVNIPTSQ